jgi:hypothetical protein
VAFAHGVPREYELRKHTYPRLKAEGLGAQAAQHTIKKVRDAYTTLRANIRAGNLGKRQSKRRRKAESKPITFRPDAAQPYDDRCLSWQYDQRTVSIWTTAGRLKGVRFVCSANALKVLQQSRKGESDLIERDGVFYLVATCEVPEAETYEPDGFIGVDLGIVNIAHHIHRLPGRRTRPEPVPQEAACPAGQAAEEAHQVRQAPAQGALPQRGAARQEHQPRHRQDDRDRG